MYTESICPYTSRIPRKLLTSHSLIAFLLDPKALEPAKAKTAPEGIKATELNVPAGL